MYEARQNKEKVNRTISSSIQKHTSHFILQRAVPTQYNETPHPIPNTGSYHARRDYNIFSKAEYPRSNFQFGKNTREDVLTQYPHQKIGNRIVIVQDVNTGQWTNVEGIQLDHRFSWENIATIMDHDRNYTMQEARNYYNDITNLQPVFGNINAAAGSAGVAVDLRLINDNINQKIGNIQAKWMNMQNYINAINGNLTSNAIFDYLNDIENAIDKFMNEELGDNVDMGDAEEVEEEFFLA